MALFSSKTIDILGLAFFVWSELGRRTTWTKVATERIGQRSIVRAKKENRPRKL